MTDVVDKVRKLLRLALSSTPAEAATALAHAQRLMHRYRIDRAMLVEADPESIELFRDEPLERGRVIAPWRQAIAGALADVNDCVCVVSQPRGRERVRVMVVAGRRVDFEALRVCYEYVVGEIVRLAEATYLVPGQRVDALALHMVRSYSEGAAAEVERRLLREHQSQRRALAADPAAMTALDLRRGEVHTWAAENLERLDARAPQTGADPDAYARGALAGRFMALRRDDGSA